MKGRLPAVLYGRADKPVGLSLSEVEMKGILRKHPESLREATVIWEFPFRDLLDPASFK
jgi:ribosomal protein L25 (general stress protein Ctc)